MSVEKLLSRQKILLVSHTFSYGAPQALRDFLKKRSGKLMFIGHPLHFCENLDSKCVVYEKGMITQENKIRGLKLPETFLFLKDFAFTILFVLSSRARYDIYIGADCLNASAGLLLKSLGLVKKVVFYTIDYTPNRFKNPIKNLMYHFLDVISVRSSDFLWNLSRSMNDMRVKQGAAREKSVVVPVGIDFDQIDRLSSQSVNRKTLVWLGHMQPWSGIELLLKAVPDIRKKHSNLEVLLIGTGPMEKILKKKAKDQKLESNIRFLGWMSHEEALKTVSKCSISVALFKPDPINRYCDPIKIKEYLACGCPVIVTRVPDIAYKIYEEKAGIAINYSKEEVVSAVTRLLDDDKFLKKCRDNAIKLASRYDWCVIFKDALQKIQVKT